VVVLWIIGILLLLLCLPVTLRVSWCLPPKGKQTIAQMGFLTEQVQEEIAALGLNDGDQTVLRQLVAELPPQQVPQKELRVSLGWLCFHWNLFPPPQKKPGKTVDAANKDKPKRKEQSSESTKPASKSIDWKKMLGQLWQCARKPVQMVLSDVCLHHLELRVRYGAPDSAQAATGAQKMGIAVYTLLGTVQNLIRVRKANLQIQPDFLSEETDWSLRFRLSIHPIVWIGAALRFAGSFLVKMIGSTKAKSTKQKQDSTNSNPSGGTSSQEQRAF
jgi:hypothetical protein